MQRPIAIAGFSPSAKASVIRSSFRLAFAILSGFRLVRQPEQEANEVGDILRSYRLDDRSVDTVVGSIRADKTAGAIS